MYKKYLHLQKMHYNKLQTGHKDHLLEEETL